MKNSEVGMPLPDEHYILDDKKYVADILQDFKAAKGRDYQSKILFKKRMFRETDETITEPQFITLSYVQVSPCCPQASCLAGDKAVSDAKEAKSYACEGTVQVPGVLPPCLCDNMEWRMTAS